MIVKNIKIQNFKSFGNNVNEINLNSHIGELILLHGVNGSGKSSSLEAIDFALYGKVRGKKKKYLTGDSLPNRYNGDLKVEIEFQTSHHEVKIIRTSSKIDLWIDHEKYDRAGKVNIQAKIEEIVGIDIETFKSFISMSINDFKNFMVLSPDEKKMLLDRLFNLEMINELTNILKEEKKQNKYQEDLYISEIKSYQASLDSISESLEKMKQASLNNLEKEREELRKQMLEKKDEFKTLKERLDTATEKEKKLLSQIRECNKRENEIDFQIQNINSKIKLIDSGKCHTCESDLSTDTHQQFKSELKLTLEKTNEAKNEVSNELKDLENKYATFQKLVKKTQNTFAELNVYLKQLKSKLDEIKDDKVATDDTYINEMLSSIDKISTRKLESEDSYHEVKHRSDLLAQLEKIFSEDGVKKSIIAKIVKPINHFIKENLEKLSLNFIVQLDDQFSANITLLGHDIEVDSLSTGETKLVNIAIMLAYLKLIRMKKHINLLFLDEVFSSIDIHNIYRVLELLKDFAREYNINVFMIHHALLDKAYFDRVLKIEKTITSQIIEE